MKYLSRVLTIYIAFVFIQSLFFKFTGSEETVIMFTTIATWMADIGLSASFSSGFSEYGGVMVGVVEMIISMLIILPSTRRVGALLGLSAMSGAIFFHLFTPLGVVRAIDSAGNTDGGVLFIMACGVWLSCAGLLYMGSSRIRNIATQVAKVSTPLHV